MTAYANIFSPVKILSLFGSRIGPKKRAKNIVCRETFLGLLGFQQFWIGFSMHYYVSLRSLVDFSFRACAVLKVGIRVRETKICVIGGMFLSVINTIWNSKSNPTKMLELENYNFNSTLQLPCWPLVNSNNLKRVGFKVSKCITDL